MTMGMVRMIMMMRVIMIRRMVGLEPVMQLPLMINLMQFKLMTDRLHSSIALTFMMMVRMKS